MIEPHALADSQARERALDATLSFIVQAPAGSGKTELLTQRFLRLLATVAEPEQILAITFTRKAASEMRHRIVRALASAAADGEPTGAKMMTRKLALAALDADRRHHWNLLKHPARLRVQTIDSVNMMLARRLPILSGTGAPLQIEEDSASLYEAACARVIERLGEGSSSARHVETLVRHLGNQLDRFATLLIELLRRRDQWLHPVVSGRGDEDLRERIEGTLQALVSLQLERAHAALPSDIHDELTDLAAYAAQTLLAEHGANGTSGAPHLTPCAQLTALPVPHWKSLEIWQGLIGFFVNKEGLFYKSVNKRQGFPTTDRQAKARMEQLLAALTRREDLLRHFVAIRELPAVRYTDEQWQILDALLHVLPLAVAELQLVFQEQGCTDYIESALRALRALGSTDDPTALALSLDYRLQHVLVDEFQDTSFTQLDLLERLTAGWQSDDGRTVFCVGDPMQSIYRFRQAEVGLFLNMQNTGLANVRLHPLRLSANFRSGCPLIEWFNATFPAVLASTVDPERGAVTYSPCDAPSAASRDGGVHMHALIEANAGRVAQEVVAITQAALAYDEHGSIGILVASRNHLGGVLRELANAGIAYQAVEIEQLHERPVVQDLIALTRALVHLGDRTAWLAVLRAPWCGLLLEDLHALVNDEPQPIIWAVMQQPEILRRLSRDGQIRITRVRDILETALSERGRDALRDWVERTWMSLGGPATLSTAQDLEDADAYLRRLEEIEIAADLPDVVQLEAQLQNLFARPRAGVRGRVEVMTIHKAKGLEFDTVILPGLERTPRGDETKLLRWTRLAGFATADLVFAPMSAAGDDKDATYLWLEKLEKERTAYERGRLLYVAVTRARRNLHLIGVVQTRQTPDSVQVQVPRRGSMLAMLWEAVKEDFADAFARFDAQQPTIAMSGTAASPLRRLPVDWTAPALAGALEAAPQLQFINTLAEIPQFDWASEVTRHAGTLVHRELQRLVRPGALAGFDPVACKPRYLAELAELGVPADRRDAAAGRVIAALQGTLSDERGQWILQAAADDADAASELALSGVLNNEIVSVVIDRTFVDSAGTRWIVDYKTGTHEGGDLEGFLQSEIVRYTPQLALYARLLSTLQPRHPIKTALYFPMLAAWREVQWS